MPKRSRTISISSPFPAPIKPPKVTLAAMVEAAVENYLLSGKPKTSDLYDQVIVEVETALLKTVLEYTDYNQSDTARTLGMNRGTLRSKIDMYGLQ